jgi:serine/threonine protein kinase/DNA-binding winged helix-turn-helix (wHTH) protein
VEVRVLGQIEATDGRQIALGGPTQRRLLAVLALHRGEVVSVDRLIDVMWPGDQRPDRAERNVHSYVHRLRAAFAGSSERIVTVGAGYRLDLRPGEFDAERYEQLAAAGRHSFDGGEIPEALDAISAARALWRGRPYGEFADEPWALGDVTRLTELQAGVSELNAEVLLSVGRSADAAAELEALIREHPLRERPRALQMQALYHGGRQAEALRVFHEFRRLLVDEVGLQPSAELVDLDRRIATGALDLADPRPARTIGAYELHERIGEGAFAVVYRATQATLGRDVAVKLVRGELANRPEFVRRFTIEAQMVARVEHPNVVPLYDYWREPDRAYLVMRLMTGGTLEARLDDGPMEVSATVAIVEQVAAALDAAHQLGVVHRDVKPENIMFDSEGRAYLADFGIALEAAERAHPEAALSEGSPLYASPEQLRREPVGPEADIFALGVVAYAMLIGRPPFADSRDEATRLRRHLEDPLPSVLASRPKLPAAIDRVLQIATAKQPDDRYPAASSFAAAFSAAVSRSGQPVDAGPAVDRPRTNPYKGLRAFEETDAVDFHGRDRLVDELVDELSRPERTMLAVVGPSGSGKSSVVRAGLLPAVRAGRLPGSGAWFVTAMNPGSHPFEALETALLRIAVNPPGSLIEQLRIADRGILRGVRRVLPDDDTILLLVIDQFEELFTSTTDPADRDLFLDTMVTALAEPGTPLRVVLTLRADFFDRPLRHPSFATILKHNTVTVTPLAADELERAIVDPAAALGVRFEPGLVARIFADVASQPGTLPLLQYTLTRLFDRTAGDLILLDDYDGIGGLSGCLARRADELWEDTDPTRRDAVRRLFERLVNLGEGAEDTRGRVLRVELGTDAAITDAIVRYGGARLLTFDRDPATREPTVEIAHEALIREWPRLRGWLDDDRETLRTHRHLSAATTAWIERQRDPAELYRGARLETAAHLSADRVALNDDERAFIRASIGQRDAEIREGRRRATRLRRFAAAAAALAVLALIAGATAYVQRGNARASAREADLGRLIAQVQASVEEDPAQALLLALEAYRLEPGIRTLGAIQTAAVGAPHDWLGDITTGRPHQRLAFLADGSLLSASGDRLEVWDLVGRRTTRMRGLGVETSDLDLSRDGLVAAVAGTDGSWQTIDVTTLETVQEGRVEGSIAVIRLDDGAGRALIGLDDGAIELVDLDDPTASTRIAIGVDQTVTDAAFRPDGGAIAVAWGFPLPVRQFELDDPSGDHLVLDGSEDAQLVAYVDGELLTVFREVHRFDAESGEPIGEPIPHPGYGMPSRLVTRDDGRFHVVGGGGITTLDTHGVTSEGRYVRGGSVGSFGGALSADARTVALGSTTGITLVAMDGAGLFVDVVVPPPAEPSQFQAISSDGTIVVQGGNVMDDIPIFVWDVSVRPPRQVLEVERGSGIRLSGNDVILFRPERGEPAYNILSQWDRASNEIRDLVKADPRSFGAFIPWVSARGDVLVHPWVTSDGIVDVYDLLSQERIARLDELTDAAGAIGAFPEVPVATADGTMLVVPTSEQYVAVYRIADWALVELLDPSEGFRQIAFAPGGAIAYTESDRGLEVRDAHELTTVLAGPVPGDGPILGINLQLTRDGRYLKTSSADGAQLWDAATLTRIGRPFPHTGSDHWSPVLATDAARLATVIDNTTVVWNIELDEWPELACLAAGRNLTEAEWDAFGPGGPYRVTCDRWSAPL